MIDFGAPGTWLASECGGLSVDAESLRLTILIRPDGAVPYHERPRGRRWRARFACLQDFAPTVLLGRLRGPGLARRHLLRNYPRTA